MLYSAPMMVIDPRELRRPKSVAGGIALLYLGFRPFYLLAAALAALSVPLWFAQYAGWLPAPHLGMMWHAHEMIFGFATAVVAGFLLTAVRTWTSRPTPTGLTLAALCVLWLAARVLAFTTWSLATTLVNTAFPLLIAVSLAIPIVRARNWRNAPFVVLLGVISVAALRTGLFLDGTVTAPALPNMQIAVDAVLLLVTMIGGRVLPMFTNNGIPGANAERRPWLDRLAIASVVLVLIVDSVGLAGDPRVALPLFVFAALANAARLGFWKPWKTLRTPLVWVLHGAFAWISLHFVLRALALVFPFRSALSLHALTIGVIGAMIAGMMVRTSRGHTGRLLLADGWDTTIFALVHASVILRVVGGALMPSAYVATVIASGVAFSLAFAIFLVRYTGFACRPRIDGKPG